MYKAHLYRLLEQKKLNKKGNVEYDSDIGEITSITKTLFGNGINTYSSVCQYTTHLYIQDLCLLYFYFYC